MHSLLITYFCFFSPGQMFKIIVPQLWMCARVFEVSLFYHHIFYSSRVAPSLFSPIITGDSTFTPSLPPPPIPSFCPCKVHNTVETWGADHRSDHLKMPFLSILPRFFRSPCLCFGCRTTVNPTRFPPPFFAPFLFFLSFFVKCTFSAFASPPLTFPFFVPSNFGAKFHFLVFCFSFLPAYYYIITTKLLWRIKKWWINALIGNKIKYFIVL